MGIKLQGRGYGVKIQTHTREESGESGLFLLFSGDQAMSAGQR